MYCETSSGNGNSQTLLSTLQQVASRADYQVLLEQAHRIWEIHRHDHEQSSYRPPKQYSR